jgi:membrane associated rhomboid family serine protease
LKATLLLILSIIVAFFLEYAFLPPSAILNLLAFSTDGLLSGQIWTPVTALYVHASYLHLFSNMVFLFVFGAALESEVGAKKTIGLFFFGGVVTFILGIPFYPPNVALIGASAAIFTLASAIMLIHPTKLTIIILPVGLVAILFFLLNVFEVATGASGGVAYISHVIGFLIGIPFGAAWSRSPWRNLAITILMLVIFLLVVWLVEMIFFPRGLSL